ncbi:MAG TPA: chemotaxis protein CheW [Syntrophobacteraceae bacterium]|nr:chemotaxis protein CheW [Syntrophobacteraceae bacterium]
MSAYEDDDLLRGFLAEAGEHLANIEADLLAIEDAGADIDEELVNKVFRAAHSIKGGSSFLGLNKIKELAHKAETVLDMVRSRRMTPNPEITNVLLAAFDKLRDMLNNAAESENADIWEHVASLNQLAASYLPEEQKDSLSRMTLLKPGKESSPIGVSEVDLERARRTGQFVYAVEYDLIHDIERKGKNVLEVFAGLYESGEILDCATDFEAVGSLDDPICSKVPLRLVFATILDPDLIGTLFEVDDNRIKLLIDPNVPEQRQVETVPLQTGQAPVIESPSDQEAILETQVETLEPQQVEAYTGPAQPALASPRNGREQIAAKNKAAASRGESTLRVDVELLESLMNLAGELVLSRNQLREAVAQKDHRALADSSQRINLVTSELQDAIMQTRMQPIGNVFGKFPRVVRDIAHAMNKEINLDIRGKDVELDKSLIEGLSDPLTHMVRNAADHGIEPQETRVRAGKKQAGTIRLEARHEAGLVVVEIADDGKGLDPQKIAASALKRGLITQDKLQGMSDKDKISLVFLPGLSTVEEVTELSGRGVGMDVVKTNLDRLGGKIEIESEPGAGTVFRIKLPLTLAIIPSLVLTAQEERFAIPQINVVELLRIRAEQVKKRIEVVGDAEVLRLRDEIVPLVRFADFLGVVSTYRDPGAGKREICRRRNLADRRSPRHPITDDAIHHVAGQGDANTRQDRRCKDGRRVSSDSDIEIVVLTTGIMKYGLVVDSFQNTEEIVVKPLGRHLKGLQEYAGATIMGDGKVALILDVSGLATRADLRPLSGSARAMELMEEAEKERLQDTLSLLLFHNAPEEVFAMPLDSVLRIEKISAPQIETVGGRRTMQYRGASLPLVTLSDAAKVKQIEDGSDLAVIVSNVQGREVGLLGVMPVDVVESRSAVDQRTHRQKGIAGSTIIRDKTVLLTDIYELVETVYPDWGVVQATRAASEKDARVTLLLAEDSDFFRAQVKRFLEEDGYTVLAAPDGEAAWELLVKDVDEIQAVITDIEMPRLSGLGLTQRIRSDPRTATMPVLGLTSLAGDEDIAKGKAAGITDYQIKLDRDRLLDGLRNLLNN